MNNNQTQSDLKKILHQNENIKKAMNNMKHEIASDLGYDVISLPYGNGDTTSREIGMFAGPVGGVIVRDLIAMGEQQLMERYKNKS